MQLSPICRLVFFCNTHDPAVSPQSDLLAIVSKVEATISQFNQAGTGIGDNRDFEYFLGRRPFRWQNRHFVAGIKNSQCASPPKVAIRLPVADEMTPISGSRIHYSGLMSEDTGPAKEYVLFSPFGSVKSAEVIQDRDTGRSKGFGFVEMSNDNAALEAIRGLNESDQGGRALTVNEARPREERSGGYRGNRSHGSY